MRGAPEDFLRLLLIQLNTRFGEDGRRPDNVADKALHEPLNLTFAVVMDAWELTEHGSSLYGTRLTSSGLRLRDALRKLDLGDEVRSSEDLDELLPDHNRDDNWWSREHQLNPKRSPDGAPFAELGQWETGR